MRGAVAKAGTLGSGCWTAAAYLVDAAVGQVIEPKIINDKARRKAARRRRRLRKLRARKRKRLSENEPVIDYSALFGPPTGAATVWGAATPTILGTSSWDSVASSMPPLPAATPPKTPAQPSHAGGERWTDLGRGRVLAAEWRHVIPAYRSLLHSNDYGAETSHAHLRDWLVAALSNCKHHEAMPSFAQTLITDMLLQNVTPGVECVVMLARDALRVVFDYPDGADPRLLDAKWTPDLVRATIAGFVKVPVHLSVYLEFHQLLQSLVCEYERTAMADLAQANTIFDLVPKLDVLLQPLTNYLENHPELGPRLKDLVMAKVLDDLHREAYIIAEHEVRQASPVCPALPEGKCTVTMIDAFFSKWKAKTLAASLAIVDVGPLVANSRQRHEEALWHGQRRHIVTDLDDCKKLNNLAGTTHSGNVACMRVKPSAMRRHEGFLLRSQ